MRLPWAPRPLPEVLRKARACQVAAGLPRRPPAGSSCGGFASLRRAEHSRQALAELSEALRHLPQGHVSFKPSMDQQRSCPTCTDSLLNGNFIITYDVNRESPANVQVVAQELCWPGRSSGALMRWGLAQKGLPLHLVPDPWSSAQGRVSCTAWG